MKGKGKTFIFQFEQDYFLYCTPLVGVRNCYVYLTTVALRLSNYKYLMHELM